MSKEQPTILLSAVGGMPSLGIIDALQEHDVRVVGIDADPYSYGIQCLDASYVVPSGDDPAFVDELYDIVQTEEIDALLCSPEQEVEAVSQHREMFLDIGCVPLCPDPRIVKSCIDKERMQNVFEDHGIPTPTTYSDVESAEFPCIVKPRFGRGSTGVNIAQNRKELSVYVDNLDQPLIQEFVAGEEYTVDLLTDEGGEVLSVIPRRRINVESGKSVTGMTVEDAEIREKSRQIASDIQLYGPSCIQCIRSNDGVQFIEVNTRFGGGSVLSMQADEELIPNLLRMVNGEPTEPTGGYEAGLVMLRNYTEMFVDRSDIEQYVQ